MTSCWTESTLLELDPSNASTHYNYGLTLIQLGEREAAVGALERALELRPNCEKTRSALSSLT